MDHTIRIGEYELQFENEYKRNDFWTSNLELIGETGATIRLPEADGEMPKDAAQYLSFLQKNYPKLKQIAYEAIAFLAKKAGTWGPELTETPALTLVQIVLSEASFRHIFTCFDLYFTDPVNDVYGLWVAEFKGTTIKGVHRKDW